MGHLRLEHNSQLEPLCQCSLLTSLCLSFYEGAHLEALAQLTQLRKLRLESLTRRDYSYAFIPLTHLEELALWGCHPSPQALGEGIAGLAGLTCLALHVERDFAIMAFPVLEIFSSLACLGNLRRLEASWFKRPGLKGSNYDKCHTTAWSILSGATRMESLDLLGLPRADGEMVRGIAEGLSALTCLTIKEMGQPESFTHGPLWNAKWLQFL